MATLALEVLNFHASVRVCVDWSQVSPLDGALACGDQDSVLGQDCGGVEAVDVIFADIFSDIESYLLRDELNEVCGPALVEGSSEGGETGFATHAIFSI